MDKPVENWNISTDKLMFHEHEKSDSIYVVKLRSHATSSMYELKLPPGTVSEVVQSQTNEPEEMVIPIN